MPEEIVLVPLGAPAAVPGSLAPDLGRVLGCRVGVGQALPLPEAAFRPERGQYVSSLLLALLSRRRGAQRLLAVTAADLFTRGLNFVFGEAEFGGRVAIISTCRLREEFWGRPANPELLRRRTLTEAVHELGHLYGLGHCPERSCVMHFSNTLADTDRKGPRFCPRCQALAPSAGASRPSS